MGAVTEVRQPVVKQKVTVYSPDDSVKDGQPQTTAEEPGKSCTSAPEMEGIRRAMDTPRSLAEMASAIGRVLRWREQLLSESHSTHRAHDYQQHFKDVLQGVKFAIKCYLCDCQKCGSHGCIAIQNIFVSGSVSEDTEVHVTKYDSDITKTIEAFKWVSEDGFVMPHWIDEREERMATEEGESSDNDAPSADTFKNASDIDFMLLAGPVKWEEGPLRVSDASESSESSGSEHVGSGTKQHGSDTVQKYDSNRTGSSDNILTLHVEEDTDKPGFVEIQVLLREGDTPVTGAVTFDFFKSAIAAAMKVEKFRGNFGPNIEVTLNGDSIDLVPCLQYPERVSDEFVNRERPSGQPSKALVKKLSEMPIYVVGKDFMDIHKFRKSFSRLESEVIRSMTKPQRICLVLLKHCAAVMGDGQCDWQPLSSYHLKTAMMWVCERRAPELWTWDGMLESMMAVLDFLWECAEQVALPCYFAPVINLWEEVETITNKTIAVLDLRTLLPRAIQLLLAGLLSSSQAPLMRHLLNLPLDAQQMLWCCWKRRVNDLYLTHPYNKIDLEGLCCELYPAAVEGRLWSERFLDTFRWESLPARCREPDWFAEHGWDTDSEGEEEEDRKDKDGEGEEEDRNDADTERTEEEGEAARKRDPDIDDESATTSKKVRLNRPISLRGVSEQSPPVQIVRLPQTASFMLNQAPSLDDQAAPHYNRLDGQAVPLSNSLSGQTSSDGISLDGLTVPVSISLSGPNVPVLVSLNGQTAVVILKLNGRTIPLSISLDRQTVPGSISLNGRTAPVFVSLNGQTAPVPISLDGQTIPVSINPDGQTAPGYISLKGRASAVPISLDGHTVPALIIMDGQTYPASISLNGLTVPVSISLDGQTTPISMSLIGLSAPVSISLNDQTVLISVSLDGQTTSYFTDLDGLTFAVSISLNGQTAPDSQTQTHVPQT